MSGKTGVRRQRAAETRSKVLSAALGLFKEHGYSGTTIESIARESGLAVQTIYFKFGNKQTILKELVDVQVAGDHEPVPTLSRPWLQDALAAEDATEQLRLQVVGARDIYRRVGPLLEVLRNAAVASEDVAPLWERNKQQRHEVQARLVEALSGKQPLVAGLSLERAIDISYGLLGPEVYHLLVVERGWTPEEWADWAYASLVTQLLGSPPGGKEQQA